MATPVFIEIERKFLVADGSWRAHVVRHERLRDGLIYHSAERKVRVRIRDDSATLTIKAKREGIRDVEFEYAIPVSDAREMLASHCGDLVLDKTRHYVPHAGLVWHVDVYEGSLDGVVLAEVELPDENTGLALAEWVGAEVTGRPEYKKINLHRMGQAALARRRAG
jgi:CYTH domain-containing protein